MADAGGLTFQTDREEWHVRWSELTDIETADAGWRVFTAQGIWYLPASPPTAYDLAHAIHRAIQAQREGLALPQGLAVPSTALSPAETERLPGDRGLSSAEQELPVDA